MTHSVHAAYRQRRRSFNWTHLDQSLQGVSGTINFVDSSTGGLVALGREGGPFFDFNRNKSGFECEDMPSKNAGVRTLPARPIPSG